VKGGAKAAPGTPFSRIWCVDFEFANLPGERPVPICVVAHELRTGERVKRWLGAEGPPLVIGDDAVMVAYVASAEVGCLMRLGWPVPKNVIDLCAEFRLAANGVLHPDIPRSLLGALEAFGIEHGVDGLTKKALQELAGAGGPFSVIEAIGLLDYCEQDVIALSSLWHRMLPLLDIPRALHRGRYMAAAARMESVGVPVDTDSLAALRRSWDDVKRQLAMTANFHYRDGARPRTRGVFDDTTFVEERFAAYLRNHRIEWPKLADGSLRLDDETFSDMARFFPQLRLLYETRKTLLHLRLEDLAAGESGRNRTLTGAFRSRTGRNQPRNSQFIFGMPSWLRSLVRPEPGTAIAYVDWCQQEFGIAAALSHDRAMMGAYESGDPYWDFAVRAGAAPPGALRRDHEGVRETYKTVVIATQYMMSAVTLGLRLGIQTAFARELLLQHRRLFAQYWRWSQRVWVTANFSKSMRTLFGWSCTVGPYLIREPSIRNWPIQAYGAEMMRLACILATECGVSVCCPVHDALLIEAGHGEMEEAVATTKDAMRRASEIVLGGFALRADHKVLCHGARFRDERGAETWERVRSTAGLGA